MYSKKWTESKLDGAKILYKKKQPYINMLWSFLGVALVQVLIRQEYGKMFIKSVWPMLGICLSWFFSQIFIFYYVIKLEKRIGSPILEDSKVR
jgi:divalent metal cation (Fe/Co/Zn/Cd) transporter